MADILGCDIGHLEFECYLKKEGSSKYILKICDCDCYSALVDDKSKYDVSDSNLVVDMPTFGTYKDCKICEFDFEQEEC